MTKKHYTVPPVFEKKQLISPETYAKKYEQSITDPDAFWKEEGMRLDWFTPYTTVKDASFTGEVSIKWYADGVLNACYNCVDRHLNTKKDQAAIIWQGDDPDESLNISYAQLHEKVCQLANALKELGVSKGDRVVIYLPMIPESAIAMLACARIGAIHSVVFAGFSAKALQERIDDCTASVIITANESVRANKHLPLKEMVDTAIDKCASIKHCIVVKRTNTNTPFKAGRDHWYEDLVIKQAKTCPCEPMNAEDPLFILFTSGSTGQPKGVLHTTGGYLTYASMTHEYIFDYHDGEIYWCTADVGWITGHSYIVYGPLANGATTLMFEGVPTYPDASRYWQICDKYKVNIFYTAPTAIRALLREGDQYLQGTKRTDLRLLGSVGEPINPDVWAWYYENVGLDQCPIVDTWWQTETGGIMITPLPGASSLKPGCAMKPFFGVAPVIMDEHGKPMHGEAKGNLCFQGSWPGQMRSLYEDHERFIKTYFSDYPGFYFSGDGAYRDKDGDIWITGRVDDVINVSGHRISTAELESAFIEHPKVTEAAVVGYSHPIKGEGIYAFLTLLETEHGSDALTTELSHWVGERIGHFVKPDVVQYASGLPKTRSGKIMRRILRKIANKKFDDFGDTSTLANPEVVNELVNHRQKIK